MTPLRQASTRAPRRSSSDPDADLVRALGPDHELVRTQRTLSVTIRRASETSALVLATPCLSLLSRDLAIAAASSAALVASILWGAAAVFGSQRRRRVHDLILQERAPQLGLIDAEVRRLLDPRHRARSAQALRRALYEGEHWHDFLPASRPPPGVRHLTPHAHVIRDIARDLDGDGITPRAVILVDQLIEGGYGAAIYQGGPDRVGRELGRLRFELTGKRVRS